MLAAFEFAYTETLFWAGIYMLPMLIETVIMSLIRGSLADKYGARVFAILGIVIVAASLFALTWKNT
ncbi:MAG: hypothetical protein RXO71_05420 [Nitrososphaeria archaeon]